MNSPPSMCPVPVEQQPIIEYQNLKDSWYFSWSTQDLRTYVAQILRLWGLSWILTGPVAAASFPLEDVPLKFGLAAGAGSTLLLGLILLRLYLGWSYIRDRLSTEKVFYEETGWYDGQFWTKPEAELLKERLISTYQVQPILQRLQRTFGVLAAILLLGVGCWAMFCP